MLELDYLGDGQGNCHFPDTHLMDDVLPLASGSIFAASPTMREIRENRIREFVAWHPEYAVLLNFSIISFSSQECATIGLLRIRTRERAPETPEHWRVCTELCRLLVEERLCDAILTKECGKTGKYDESVIIGAPDFIKLEILKYLMFLEHPRHLTEENLRAMNANEPITKAYDPEWRTLITQCRLDPRFRTLMKVKIPWYRRFISL